MNTPDGDEGRSAHAIDTGAGAGYGADTERSSSFAAPSIEGLHVQLRPIMPADYGFLQAMELTTDLRFRFRFRGTTPSPEQWAQALWQGVLAQFLVVSRASERPIGLVMAYRANFQDGHAYIGAVRLAPEQRTPLLMLGFGIFIEYVFGCWNFRKLYIDTPEYNYDQFASGRDRIFVVEGRLSEHSFFGGRYWDQLTLAIYREAWAEHADRLLGVESRPGARVVKVHVPSERPPLR